MGQRWRKRNITVGGREEIALSEKRSRRRIEKEENDFATVKRGEMERRERGRERKREV